MNESAIYSLGCLARVGRVELTVSVDRQEDGTWLAQFDVHVWDDEQLEQKVPTTLLQRYLQIVLGIETEFAGSEVCQSLVGPLAARPDPTEFYAKIEAMLKNADVELLWREPQPAAWCEDKNCFLDPELP